MTNDDKLYLVYKKDGEVLDYNENFKIHFLYYIFLIFVTITGNFNNYVIFTLLYYFMN
jgi:hypothetical protein